MPVYDLIVLAFGAALVARGWMRGALREALDLGVLLLGVVVVFRFSPVLGSIIAGMANIPFEVARLAAGVAVFLGLVVGGALAARVLSTMLKLVPGATVLNRVGGAVVGAGYAAVVVVLGTTLVLAAPLPDGLRATIDESVASSTVGRYVAEPGGLTQKSVASVSGERVFSTVIALHDAVGARLAAGTIPIPLPDVGDAMPPPSQRVAQEVFDALNRSRIAEGLDPLGWSSDLAVVAVSRSGTVYRSGVLTLDDELAASLSAQGVPGTINTDMVVLAATSHGVVEAFTEASAYRLAILDKQYHTAGIGVVEGPYGLLSVMVLTS